VVTNPYVQGHKTFMRVTLPCDMNRAWELIGTPAGLEKWFPKRCEGQIISGQKLIFHWLSDPANEFSVLEVMENKWWEMSWFEGGKVRYRLEDGSPVIFNLEVHYPESEKGKEIQILELPPWGFLLANLKSIASNGPDLRNQNTRFNWREGFIE